MLDTGSSFNWIATNKVGKSLLNFQIPFDEIFEVVHKNVTVDVSNLEGNTKRKTKVVNFELSLLEGLKIEAYTIDHIHTFSKLKLPDHVTSNYRMDQPYPRAGGEVDLLLGIIDTLKLVTDKHVSVTNTLALIPTCYGYVPWGQEIVENFVADSTESHTTYLISTETLRLWKRCGK